MVVARLQRPRERRRGPGKLLEPGLSATKTGGGGSIAGNGRALLSACDQANSWNDACAEQGGFQRGGWG